MYSVKEKAHEYLPGHVWLVRGEHQAESWETALNHLQWHCDRPINVSDCLRTTSPQHPTDKMPQLFEGPSLCVLQLNGTIAVPMLDWPSGTLAYGSHDEPL